MVCVFLINFGATIHTVKLTTSLIYLLRPIFLRYYVNKNYFIDRHIKYDEEPIKQKWNGVAQHVAAVILDSTDNIVLTIFSTMSNVSIYSVYNLVVYGVKQLFMSMTNGIHSLIGELWAKQELVELKKVFGWFEWIIHFATVIAFGCTGCLIIPFVAVYTKGINDAMYIQPLFAVLIVMAHAGHCLRLPYNIMILAGGHYKQTQKNYVVAAVLNIVVSIVTVVLWGLVGVAIGTLIAMIYQTVWMALYDSKNLIKWPFKNFIKQILVDSFTVISAAMVCLAFDMSAVNYVSWIILAIKVACVWVLIAVIVNLLFYREKTTRLIQKVVKR